MTFTEAAIEVLRREGKPLHFKKIAEIAVRDSLLDHVGKIPEEVMGGQLATHCRLPHADRRVMVVQSGTFALVEWGLDEDPAGLDHLIEPPPEDEAPYRPRERHPTPSREVARTAGRGEARARRREEGEERRARRYPPPAEVAYEILAGATRPLTLADVAAQGVERFLMPDAFVRDHAALAAALLEDNRRRESAGRKPLFAVQDESVSLAAQPEPGERATAPLAPARAPASASELRKSALLALRRRLQTCDGATVEHVAARLLEAMGLEGLKVAKRGREHVVYTGGRKLGFAEVRHCIRILRGPDEPGRRDVVDARRDVGNYGAQIGILIALGDAGRDARREATAAGQLPVLLLTGEALAEALTEHAVGCRPVTVPELDDAWFQRAAEAAQAEEAARRARREDRERREREARGEGTRRREDNAAAPAAESTTPAVEAVAPAEVVGSPAGEPSLAESATPGPVASAADADDPELEGEDGEGDDEGDEAGEGEGAAAAAGEAAPGTTPGDPARTGKRRRRRRRRRGGRGRREGAPPQGAGAEGAPPAAAAEASASGSGDPSAGAAEPRPEAAPQPPPAPAPAAPAPSSAAGGEGAHEA